MKNVTIHKILIAASILSWICFFAFLLLVYWKDSFILELFVSALAACISTLMLSKFHSKNYWSGWKLRFSTFFVLCGFVLDLIYLYIFYLFIVYINIYICFILVSISFSILFCFFVFCIFYFYFFYIVCYNHKRCRNIYYASHLCFINKEWRTLWISRNRLTSVPLTIFVTPIPL